MELTRRQLIQRGAEAGLALGLIGTGLGSALSLSAPYANEGRLASASWLRRRYDAVDRVRVLDARPPLVYRRGHIPNAVNVWDNDINVWGRIPRQLASVDALTETFAQAGIAHDRTVVVYDGADGRWAARLFWALEHVGHPDVRLLNGGLANWKAAGGAMSDRAPSVASTDVELQPGDGKRVTADWLRARMDGADAQIVDARSFAAFADGHIPDAVSWPADGLVANNGTFKRAHPLRLSARDAGLALQNERPTVVYSDTGLAAARAYVALRLLGLTDVKLYDGGWAEWSTLSDVPVEQASSATVSARQDHRSTCW
ncbi:MAG: sulfurtransferase [Salinibacter sp.]